MEKFLEFWSHYNATIIEVLVGLILLSTIYLVYRTFFGTKGVDALETSTGAMGAVGINTGQIEKTLQKILEQQSTLKAAPVSGDGAERSLEVVQELGLLKKALEEKEKQIVVLQDKASQVMKMADSGPSAEAIAAAASAAAGMAEKERSDFEAKIKELEGRLAEYEIISEDIADLSFYKEENARLTQELEALRGGSGGAPAPAPAPSAPAAPPVDPEDTVSSAEPSLDSFLEPSLEAAPAAPLPAEGGDAIDESLMAEFAKAVEGQKSSEEKVSSEDDNSKLLEEFENFNKKS